MRGAEKVQKESVDGGKVFLICIFNSLEVGAVESTFAKVRLSSSRFLRSVFARMKFFEHFFMHFMFILLHRTYQDAAVNLLTFCFHKMLNFILIVN